MITAYDPAKLPASLNEQIAGALMALDRAADRTGSTAGYIGSNTINGTTQVIQGSITTPSIAAGSITASLISVTSLDALTANMGNLTVNGTLTIGGAGTIRTTVGNQATEFNAAGVKSYDIPSGVPTFNLSSSTGILTAKMVIQTGTQMPLGFIGGGNLLSNSSAERPDLTITGWNVYSTGGSTVVVDGAQAFHGLKSFKVTHTTSTGGEGIATSSPTTIVTGLKYTQSAYFYPTVSRQFSICAYHPTPGVFAQVTVTLPANQWSRISQTWTAPASAPNVTTYATSQLALGVGESYYIDAIQLEQGEIATAYAPRGDEVLPGSITVNELSANSVSATQIQTDAVTSAKIFAGAVTAAKFSGIIAGGNLVSTATTSFEQDISGWIATATITNNGGATIAQSGTQAYYGTKSMLVTTTAGSVLQGPSIVSIPGPWRAGRKYMISAYVYPSVSTSLNIGAGPTPFSGTYINAQTAVVANTWQRIVGTYTPSADHPNLGIGIGTVSAVAMTFYVDGVMIEEGDVATAWKQYVAPATIEGSTITGALIQTALAGTNPRVSIDSVNGMVLTDSTGNAVTRIRGAGGAVDIATSSFAAAPNERKVRWIGADGTIHGSLYALDLDTSIGFGYSNLNLNSDGGTYSGGINQSFLTLTAQRVPASGSSSNGEISIFSGSATYTGLVGGTQATPSKVRATATQSSPVKSGGVDIIRSDGTSDLMLRNTPTTLVTTANATAGGTFGNPAGWSVSLSGVAGMNALLDAAIDIVNTFSVASPFLLQCRVTRPSAGTSDILLATSFQQALNSKVRCAGTGAYTFTETGAHTFAFFGYAPGTSVDMYGASGAGTARIIRY